MNKRYQGALLAVLMAGLSCVAVAAPTSKDDSDIGGVLFRYQDENGNQVVHQSIPPDVAPRGYEIISKGGHLLKTVPPAPKGADVKKMVEQMRREAELEEWDTRLRRRYSTVADIESAKQRSLSELQGNISILRANWSGVHAQLESQQSRAAAMERSGRQVSATVAQNIQDLEEEQVEINKQIDQRNAELQEEAGRFDRDIARFREIGKQ